MNIDFTNNTITKQLPQLTNFSNERVITLEKITGNNNVDSLFLIRMTDIDGNISYLNKSYERNFSTRNIASVFNVQDKDKQILGMKVRLVRQEEAQTAIRRFNPFIGKPNLEIKPDSSHIELSFEINPSMANKVDNFVIILAKYDKNKNQIGHLKVHTSKENNQGRDICTTEMGRKKCKYTLTDIDHIDNNGDILYYRVSIIAVSIGNVISNYVEPLYPGGLPHFIMSKTFQDMEDIILKTKNESLTEQQMDKLNSKLISEAGGEYEFHKQQLGGFPDNLVLDINKNTLSDLVDDTMSLGEINVIVD
jgi:hypothetical protein